MAKIDSTPVSLLAGADLRLKQWRFGKRTANGVEACSALGEHADGIIGSPGRSGDAIDFYLDRIVKISIGAPVLDGAELTPDLAGDAVTAIAGNVVRAKALEASSTVGALIEVLLVAPFVKT